MLQIRSFYLDPIKTEQNYKLKQHNLKTGPNKSWSFRYRTIISMPQPNGTIYTFGRDVNILWRHGIPQIPQDKYVDQGRIYIIAWGWNEQFDL